MILIDNNQILMANTFVTEKILLSTGLKIEDVHADQVFTVFRRQVLHSYARILELFPASEFGEVILCHDSSSCWREEVFPYYKYSRKESRKTDSNTDDRYAIINQLRDEVAVELPFKNMKVEGAEADDIIAVLTRLHTGLKCKPEPIVIVSADKDFKQLHDDTNVKQFDYFRRKYIEVDDPKDELIDQIVRGDATDGIPNMFTPDSIFLLEGTRQTPCSKKKINHVKTLIDDDLNMDSQHTESRNWNRNRTLIDFECIPMHIQQKIFREYTNAVVPPVSFKSVCHYYSQSGTQLPSYLLEEEHFFKDATPVANQQPQSTTLPTSSVFTTLSARQGEPG